MTLEIINDTGMEMAYIAGRIPFPGHSLTLIVKGVFDLSPDGVATLAAEQLYPTGDEFYENDPDKIGSPRYPSDFGYLKPKTDLMLVGSCHAPPNEKITAQNITFGVGDFRKTLQVIGDKYWESKIIDQDDNVCQPYSTIELRYENAFGGEGYADNPVGKGNHPQQSSQGEFRKLFPNILNEHDNPNAFITNLHPAGFGPVAPTWPARHGFIGRYKGNYLKKRWPWYAENFDFHYFNAAPADQQVAAYLIGDEELLFENIHPTIRTYTTQLPGLRCRCFTHIQGETPDAANKFQEIPLNLDTIWVDIDAEQVVLVWRGWTEINDEDFPELEGLFIIKEPLSQPAKPLTEYQTLFMNRLAEVAGEDDPTDEEEDDTSPQPQDVDEELNQAEKKMKANLIKAGIDPDNPPPRSEEDLATEQMLLAEMGIEKAEDSETKLTPETFMAAYATGQQFTDVIIEDLDLSGQDLSAINFTDSILKNIDLSHADLSGANLTDTTLIDVTLTAVNLSNSCLDRADFTGINLAEANLNETTVTETIFAGANMSQTQFQKANGQGCNLTGAKLIDSQFQHSNFTQADFSHATLTNANFSHAILDDASFEEVQAQQIIMDHANLTTLRASDDSDFSHGSFKQATGGESIWEGANLNDSDFSFCHLEEADFSHASLQRANLHAANMRKSRFNKADLTDATATFMNLFAGSLKKATLNNTNFSDANLYGVEFLEAQYDSALFTNSNLKKSKLA